MKPQNPSLYHFRSLHQCKWWRGESLNWMRTLWCLPFVHKSIINRHLCFVSALKDDGGIINVMLFPKGIGVDTMQPGDNNLDHSLAAVWTIWIIHWGCNKKESKLGRNKAIGQFSHDFEWKEEKKEKDQRRIPHQDQELLTCYTKYLPLSICVLFSAPTGNLWIKCPRRPAIFMIYPFIIAGETSPMTTSWELLFGRERD